MEVGAVGGNGGAPAGDHEPMQIGVQPGIGADGSGAIHGYRR